MSSVHIPHTVRAHWPDVKPERFAAGVRSEDPTGCALALLGLPDDTGVQLNGGRPGAAAGPAAFRAALARFGSAWDGRAGHRLGVGLFDAGDVEPAAGRDASALEETHARVEAAVAELHSLGLVPVCVGGGHDLSLPSIRALSKHLGGMVGGINVDAHLDVRERVGSGMAFRRLIDGGFVSPRAFVELGLGRFANSEADLAWASQRGVTLVSVEAARSPAFELSAVFDTAYAGGRAGFLSVDLDALDAASAPGVSASSPAGLDVQRVAELCEAAGAAPAVRHFDLMELCPAHDEGGRTARVAAYLLLSFVAGYEARPR